MTTPCKIDTQRRQPVHPVVQEWTRSTYTEAGLVSQSETHYVVSDNLKVSQYTKAIGDEPNQTLRRCVVGR